MDIAEITFSRNYYEFFDIQTAPAEHVAEAERDFRTNLTQLLRRLDVSGENADAIAEQLWTRMIEPVRHYHTPMHVLAMLATAKHEDVALSYSEQLAVWFHDAIFDTDAPPGRNENDSADWLVDLCETRGLRRDVAQEAAESIRWTAGHLELQVPQQHWLVMDLDLSGLAAPPPIFKAYCRAVRQEMNHLSDQQYARATVDFFTTLLHRPSIYRSQEFAHLEDIARRQVENDIARLTAMIEDDD